MREPTPQIYQHKKRPEWGLAILTWEGPQRRRFQFQDGRIRTFKRGYYGLLEAVDKPRDLTERVVRELKSMLKATQEEHKIRQTVLETGKPMLTLADQIAAFKDMSPAASGARPGSIRCAPTPPARSPSSATGTASSPPPTRR